MTVSTSSGYSSECSCASLMSSVSGTSLELRERQEVNRGPKVAQERLDVLSASSTNRALVQLFLIFLSLLGVDVELGEQVVWWIDVAESLVT